MFIDKVGLEVLRNRFPKGTRVKLDRMDDPYCTILMPGDEGTVDFVDDAGTIHVSWDCGSSLGVVYGEDKCHRVSEKEGGKK